MISWWRVRVAGGLQMSICNIEQPLVPAARAEPVIPAACGLTLEGKLCEPVWAAFTGTAIPFSSESNFLII